MAHHIFIYFLFAFLAAAVFGTCGDLCKTIKNADKSITEIGKSCDGISAGGLPGGSIPDEIGELTALTFICLRQRGLTGTVPKQIRFLTALTTLILTENELTAIPRGISELTALKKLYVNRNQLTAIPQEFSTLLDLTQFYFGRNNIKCLPSIVNEMSIDGEWNDFLGRGVSAGSLPSCAEVEIDWVAQASAVDKTLKVAPGNVITFTWTGSHNVYSMPSETAWAKCNFDDATLLRGWASGVTFTLKKSATTYYASKVDGECASGLKVAITAASTSVRYETDISKLNFGQICKDPWKPPAGCKTFFDGCNNCFTSDTPGEAICESKTCDCIHEEGYCKVTWKISARSMHNGGSYFENTWVGPTTATFTFEYIKPSQKTNGINKFNRERCGDGLRSCKKRYGLGIWAVFANTGDCIFSMNCDNMAGYHDLKAEIQD